MASIELPEEYKDWVEVDDQKVNGDKPYIRVITQHFGPRSFAGTRLSTRYFAAPKPKPTVPDVTRGGVIEFTDKTTRRRVRMVRGTSCWFDASFVYGDAALLDRVSEDGITVVLEGL